MNDEYRFRRLDASDETGGEMTMVCLDDEAALLLAERLALAGAVEVWTQDRLVGLVAASAPAAAPAQGAASGEPSAPETAHSAASRRRFKPFWSGGWRRGAREGG